MYVNHLQFRDVKCLRRDIPVDSQSPEPVPNRLLLQGANGSGKTTVLETIRTLWEFFGEWSERGDGKAAPAHQTRHYLGQVHLAAMELANFPSIPQSLWLGIGDAEAWNELKQQHSEALFAGLIRNGKSAGQPRIELSATHDWRALRLRSMAGSEPQPNIVHIPPDNRSLAAPPKEGAQLLDTTRLNWSAVFDPTLDVDSILLTVKALRPQDFSECLRLINAVLEYRQKRIVDFGPDGRLIVEGESDFGSAFQHPLEQLSSGERQMLLLVTYGVAFLRPGGILLVDEPDLHIHIALVRPLLDTLYRIVKQRNGQLIVAAHSQNVWSWFARSCERIELSPWRGGAK